MPAASAPAPITWRFTALFLATVGLPVSLVFVCPRAPQNGIAWDLLMMAGLVGAGLMITLPLVSPRLWLRFGGEPRALRTVLNLHADISYIAVILVLVHTLGLVFLDTLLIEYLKLSAPWSMLAALASAILLVALLFSTWYRIALKIRYRPWRLWHVGMSLLAVGLMSFHVADAAYFVNSHLKLGAFVLLAAGPSLMSLAEGAFSRGHVTAPADGGRETPAAVAFSLPAARAAGTRLVGLLSVLLIAATIAVAIPKPGSRAETEAHACLATRCE